MKKIFILCSLCTQFSFCEIGEDSLSLIASVNENLDEKQTSLDEKWIPKLEKYFTKYEICQSKIEQIDHLGNVLQGQFWLKRSSGCMKLQYDSKNEKVVLVKGGKLTLYDPELKEKTVTSLHSFALSFFLDKILDLRKNIKVIGVIRHKGDIFIKLCNKNDETGGAIMLIFSEQSFHLKGWIILSSNIDIYCKFIHVQLISPNVTQPIPDNVFTLSNSYLDHQNQ